MRKGEGADRQRAKVMGNFTTEGENGKSTEYIKIGLLGMFRSDHMCMFEY